MNQDAINYMFIQAYTLEKKKHKTKSNEKT